MLEKFTMTGPGHRNEIKKNNNNNIFKTHAPLLQRESKNSKNRNKDQGDF